MKTVEHLDPKEPEVEAEPKAKSGEMDHPFDPVAFDAAMQKWRGFLREQMLEDGYTTTEELMNDIRGRDGLVF